MRYYLEYIFYKIIVNFTRLLSVDRSSAIFGFLGRKIGPYLSFTKIVRKNLHYVYKEHEIDIDKTIDQLWDNFGRYIGEFPFINRLSEEEINKRITIVGLEYLREYQKNSQPFMLFLSHSANWDFLIRRIKMLYPEFAIAYRKSNNPYVDKEIIKERSKSGVLLIPKGVEGSRSLLKAIKSKMSIAMLVDQKMNEGIELPFFGKKAMTAPAIAKLALRYNYPIVPCQLKRINGCNFEIIVKPALTYTQTDNNDTDVYNIMKLINDIVEKWVREEPSQWLWFHNRWK